MAKERDDGSTLLSHLSTGTTAKASSVLQNNTKVYGPAKALDCENALTSWNSEGSPNGKKASFLIIDFSGGGKLPNRRVKPEEICIQFQAGFAAEEITAYVQITGGGDKPKWLKVEEIEADDDHELQTFPLSVADETTALKIVFDETTDFYGRVIVYQLQVWGKELGE
mmetsp:Transcript_18415/g.45647  ORF Transcript_18415/g.45647 Transcript_18415/m.45647 type:complete len:168 (-) Transcript_18415:281-784(-)